MIRQLIIFSLLLTFIGACSQNPQKGEGISNSVIQKSDSVNIIQKKDSVNINQEKANGPKINFELNFKDLGEVLQGSDLSYKFEFSNPGTEELIITNVRTSCHCTVASYPKTPIGKGESESVLVDLDTKTVGEFTKTVAVYSNALNHYADDVGQSRVLLKIKWAVAKSN
jgi:hypothetical protein